MVITVTREMRDNLGKRGADVNKIAVVVNVPDDRMFAPERYEGNLARVREIKKEERRKGVPLPGRRSSASASSPTRRTAAH